MSSPFRSSFSSSSSSFGRRHGGGDHRHHHRRRRLRRGRNNNANPGGGPVGTEAVALEHLERNRKEFRYPPEGFETRIEYSLLYSMIRDDSSPSIYPREVVLRHIQEEDFDVYLTVAESASSKKKTTTTTTSSSSYNSSTASTTTSSQQQQQQEHDNNDHDTTTNSTLNQEEEEEEHVSYAQLSAILALAADQFPPPKENESTATTTTTNSNNNSNNSSSIAQSLGKAVMQCVVAYAQRHDLDRSAELRELLDPVERYAIKRTNRQSLHMVLPLYVGYAASLVTLNPIPVMVGAVMFANRAEKASERAENMQSIASEASRKADVEKASLLEEEF